MCSYERRNSGRKVGGKGEAYFSLSFPVLMRREGKRGGDMQVLWVSGDEEEEEEEAETVNRKTRKGRGRGRNHCTLVLRVLRQLSPSVLCLG